MIGWACTFAAWARFVRFNTPGWQDSVSLHRWGAMVGGHNSLHAVAPGEGWAMDSIKKVCVGRTLSSLSSSAIVHPALVLLMLSAALSSLCRCCCHCHCRHCYCYCWSCCSCSCCCCCWAVNRWEVGISGLSWCWPLVASLSGRVSERHETNMEQTDSNTGLQPFLHVCYLVTNRNWQAHSFTKYLDSFCKIFISCTRLSFLLYNNKFKLNLSDAITLSKLSFWGCPITIK